MTDSILVVTCKPVSMSAEGFSLVTHLRVIAAPPGVGVRPTGTVLYLLHDQRVQTCALGSVRHCESRQTFPTTSSQKELWNALPSSDPDPTPPPTQPPQKRRIYQQLTLALTPMLTLMLTLTPSLGRLTSARDTAVHASPRSRTSRAFLLAGGTGRNARRLTKNLTYLLVYLPTLPPSRNKRRHVSSSPAVTLGRRGASCSSGSITAAPSMRSCKMHSACAAGRQAGRQLRYST
jgi:hypothetical protein